MDKFKMPKENSTIEEQLTEANPEPHWEHYVLKFINLYPHGKVPYWTIHDTEDMAKQSSEKHALKVAVRIEVKK